MTRPPTGELTRLLREASGPRRLAAAGLALHAAGFLPPEAYRDPNLVHRLDNAATVATITRGSGGRWLPLHPADDTATGRTTEHALVLADCSPTALHAFATGEAGPLTGHAQLISFASADFRPSGTDRNRSAYPASDRPVRPVHLSAPLTQTAMYYAVRLLTAYNFGGLTERQRHAFRRGWSVLPATPESATAAWPAFDPEPGL